MCAYEKEMMQWLWSSFFSKTKTPYKMSLFSTIQICWLGLSPKKVSESGKLRISLSVENHVKMTGFFVGHTGQDVVSTCLCIPSIGFLKKCVSACK